MKKRPLGNWIAIGIIATGLSVLAWGLWIPVKAVLAQQLLDLAWERLQNGVSDARPWPWADILPAFLLSLPGHDRTFVVLDNSSGEAMASIRAMAASCPGSQSMISGSGLAVLFTVCPR